MDRNDRKDKIKTAANQIAFGLYHLLSPNADLKQRNGAVDMLRCGLEVALDLLVPEDPAL